MKDKSILSERDTPLRKTLPAILTHELAILIYLGIVICLLYANDYGLSWDEYYHEMYAEQTIQIYLGQRAPRDTITDLRFYGPAYNVPWLLARNLLVNLFPSWQPADAGHFLYWLTFIPAPLLLYCLARRYVPRIPSLAAALLFASQPVIFGYAFINPKDNPFMTAFLAALWLGLIAVDLNAQNDSRLSLKDIPSEMARLAKRISTAWRNSTSVRKVGTGTLLVAIFLLFVDLFVTHKILQWAYVVVGHAYNGQALAPVQAMFDALATDVYKTSLSIYLIKVRTLYLWVRFPIVIIILGLIPLMMSRLLRLPISWGWFSRTRIWWVWIIASIAFGYCSAIRVFGPFAGALVALYAFAQLRKKAWLPIILYAFFSILVLYIAWPSLWGAPLQNLADSVFLMAKFPFQGTILYDSKSWHVWELPWHYVPRTLGMRLTIPALLLFGLGLLTILVDTLRTNRLSVEVSLLLIWWGLPLAATLLLDVQIYEAFRQLMFILPPIFIISAIGFDKVLGGFHKPALSLLVMVLAILSGVIWIIRLHPYEVMYYNQFVGGVSGAEGVYTTNAWGTSSGEAIEYINEVAEPGAQVLINSNEWHMITPLARDDLELGPLTHPGLDTPSSGTYLINAGELGEDYPTITLYVVEREGVTLATVKKLIR